MGGVDDGGAVAGQFRTTPRSWERVWTSAPTVGSSSSTSDGSADQGDRRVQPPPLAAGQLLGPPPEQLGQAEQFSELIDLRTALLRPIPARPVKSAGCRRQESVG